MGEAPGLEADAAAPAAPAGTAGAAAGLVGLSERGKLGWTLMKAAEAVGEGQ